MPLINFFCAKPFFVLGFPYVLEKKGINSLDIYNIYVCIHVIMQYKLSTAPEAGEVVV